jgi:Amt family ammonium transporter
VFGHHMMALILVSVYTFLERIFCLKSPIEYSMRVQRNQGMGLDLSQHDETLFPIECAD